MSTFNFHFSIKPEAWQRAGYSGKSKRFYTPSEMLSYQRTLKALARLQLNQYLKPIITGPIKVMVYFSFKRPKKTILYSPRVDLDNLQKNLWDSLNKIVYLDDTQIFESHAIKRWAEEDGIFLTIEEIETKRKA